MAKRKEGAVEFLSAFMVICLAGLLLAYSFSLKELRQYQSDARDALDGACLSAALIDLDRYPYGRFINIKQYGNSWAVFKKCLKNNMNLDDGFNAAGGAIYDKVAIHEFIIYNIIEGDLVSCRIDGDGTMEYETADYDGSETTPDGTRIESSTVYADIGMDIKTFLGIEKYVHVKTSVDVVNN